MLSSKYVLNVIYGIIVKSECMIFYVLAWLNKLLNPIVPFWKWSLFSDGLPLKNQTVLSHKLTHLLYSESAVLEWPQSDHTIYTLTTFTSWFVIPKSYKINIIMSIINILKETFLKSMIKHCWKSYFSKNIVSIYSIGK